MAGGSNEPGRTVTSKSLAILFAFESGRRSLSLSELAEAAHLPLSTTHRLVAELVEWGALARDPQGRIQLGLRLWELGQNAGRALRDTAHPFIQDLSRSPARRRTSRSGRATRSSTSTASTGPSACRGPRAWAGVFPCTRPPSAR
ncbi:helix-turn-helix domain-containing protein [Sinomonas flava]|uniref:helix-turn-helix domain-containing protein n=1 Tax=Sinomonas flava TaxID=496857 RepID=UPI0039A773CC